MMNAAKAIYGDAKGARLRKSGIPGKDVHDRNLSPINTCTQIHLDQVLRWPTIPDNAFAVARLVKRRSPPRESGCLEQHSKDTE